MLPIARWQQRCTGWMEPSKQALKSGILACTLLTSPAFALSVDDAKHLALRTSFAANPSLMNALLPLSREEAVDYVLNQVEPHPVEPPEFTVNPEPRPNLNKLSEPDRKKFYQGNERDKATLRSWWVNNLIQSNSGLNEIMVLFWENHFTSSIEKPNDPLIAYKKNMAVRYNALGRFDYLVKDIFGEAALIIYLDNNKNLKGNPNENLARELLELYMLGEGNYTEDDVKEVARSLTGWTVSWPNRSRIIDYESNDSGTKSVFGVKGNYDMIKIIDLLMSKDEVSILVTKKMWKLFVSDVVDEDEVMKIASIFKKSGYQIKVAIRAILLNDNFWKESNRANLVKSPIEMLIGLYRQAGVDQAPSELISKLSGGMGQNLFAPPNVKGWPIASNEWINSETLLKRQNAINRLMRAKESNPNMTDKEAVLNDAMQKWAGSEAFNYQKDWLLAAPPVGDVESDDPMETLKNLLNDPVYQLK